MMWKPREGENARARSQVLPNLRVWRVTGYGLVSWAIPLIVSFFFYDRGGQPVVPLPLFKSVMVVVGGGVGSFLLVAYFRRFGATTQAGLLVGVYWLALNILLDLLVLLPITGMTLAAYFHEIGLRYLLIPIIGAAMGTAASERRAA